MEFALGTGQVLQKELDRIRNDEGDHILARLVPYWEGWYLSSRDPLPVHSNPFYLFASDSLPRESCPLQAGSSPPALSAAHSAWRSTGELSNLIHSRENPCA